MQEKPKRGQTAPSGNATLAIILIAVGVIFLLGNIGLFAGIARLWPLILVVVGAWLLFSRGGQQALQLRHERFAVPLDGAQAARVRLSPSAGETRVFAGGDPALLLDADLNYIGDIRFVDEGSQADRFVSLGQGGEFHLMWINPANWLHDQMRLEWAVGLNPTVPTDLDIHSGVGKAVYDLGRLNLTALDITGGVAETDVTLPASGAPYDARIQSGIGRMNIVVPPGAAVNLRVKGGVGETNIETPPQAAVRVSARTSVGDINLGARFQRVAGAGSEYGIGKSGTWETAHFSAAEQQINIEFEGGVGQLRIR